MHDPLGTIAALRISAGFRGIRLGRRIAEPFETIAAWRRSALFKRPLALPGAPSRSQATRRCQELPGPARRCQALPSGSQRCQAWTGARRRAPRRCPTPAEAHRRCQALRGAARRSQALRGAARRSQALSGAPKRCQALRGAPRRCQELPGAPRRPQALPGAARRSQALPRRARAARLVLPGTATRCQALKVAPMSRPRGQPVRARPLDAPVSDARTLRARCAMGIAWKARSLVSHALGVYRYMLRVPRAGGI